MLQRENIRPHNRISRPLCAGLEGTERTEI